MENDIKAGDGVTDLKHENFDENKIMNEVTNDLVAEEYIKSSHTCKESTKEDLQILCTQFERMEFPKSDLLRHDYSDQEVARSMDIRICRKQLSPNSSFGFVPHLDACDSLKYMTKIDSEDSQVETSSTSTGKISAIQNGISQILQNEPDSEKEMGKIDTENLHGETLTSETGMNLRNKISDIYLNKYDTEKDMEEKNSEDSDSVRSKTHIEELRTNARQVSQTCNGLLGKISSAEVHFNDKIQDAKEQNKEGEMDFVEKSDQISTCGNYFIEEIQDKMASNILDKYEMDDIKDTNNTYSEIVHSSDPSFIQMCSFLKTMVKSEEKRDEEENTDETGTMEFQKQYCSIKEKPATILFVNDADEDHDKSDEFEPKIVFEKEPRIRQVFIKSEIKEGEEAELNFCKPMNSQKENFATKEKPKTTNFEIGVEDNNGKFDEFEPQIVFEKMPKLKPVSIKTEKRESQEAERNFAESMDSPQETFVDKPENTVEVKNDFPETLYLQQKMLLDEFKCKCESTSVRNDVKDNNDKCNQSYPQIVVQKPWIRKLFESQPSVHKSKKIQPKEKEDERAKTKYLHPMDFLRKTFLDKENPQITTSSVEAKSNHVKSDKTEPQIVAHKSLRRRWNNVDRYMPGYNASIKTTGEDPENFFIKSTDSQQGKFLDEEKRETTFFENVSIDDHDKHNQNESKIVVDKSMRKTWPELRLPQDKFRSSPRRDPRWNRALYPASRPNFGKAGEVPPDRFYIQNSYMNSHTKHQNACESSRGITECNFSGSSSNEIRRRSNSAAPSHNLFERQKPVEEKSNANPQNIPYSGKKLCKQSHSTENLGDISKEIQAELNEDVCDSVSFIKQENLTSLNEVEITSEIDVNESEEIFFEASDRITQEENLGTKESEEKKLKKCKEVLKDDVSVALSNNQNVMIHDKQNALSDLFTYSKDKSETNLGNGGNAISDKNITEEYAEKLSTAECIKMEKKCFDDHNRVALDAQKEKVVNHHNELTMKCGLNAASGDFVHSINDANEQDHDYEINVTDPDENEVNEAQQNNESGGGISMEYFEEVIAKVIEEQKYEDDDLNTSFYPESDSSYIEIEESSDFSDTDGSTIQDQ